MSWGIVDGRQRPTALVVPGGVEHLVDDDLAGVRGDDGDHAVGHLQFHGPARCVCLCVFNWKPAFPMPMLTVRRRPATLSAMQPRPSILRRTAGTVTSTAAGRSRSACVLASWRPLCERCFSATSSPRKRHHLTPEKTPHGPKSPKPEEPVMYYVSNQQVAL